MGIPTNYFVRTYLLIECLGNGRTTRELADRVLPLPKALFPHGEPESRLDLSSPRKMAVYIHRLAHAGYVHRVYQAGLRYVTSLKGLKWLHWYLSSRNEFPVSIAEIQSTLIHHAHRLAILARTDTGRMRLIEFARKLETVPR